MSQKLIVFLFLGIFLVSSCAVHKRKKHERICVSEGTRIGKCMQHWDYENIYNKEFRVTILSYYSTRVYGETSWPNFLIGVTESGDTIGFLDKYYAAPLKKNDRVLIVEGDWDKANNITDYPRYQYSTNVEKNDFLCKINLVLRGRILFKLDN